MKQYKQNRKLHLVETKAPKYPNAADRSYYIRRTVDVITAIVSGMGLVSAMLFLVVLS